jgi:hypothetical protein
MVHARLTTLGDDPLLDLEPWDAQRQATFRFQLTNGATGEQLGDITPIRTATMSHDTSRTIKRQLNIALGVADVAAINPVTDRIQVYMTFPNGASYPLGTFMFTNASRQVFTSGKLGNFTMSDLMFLVDQPIEQGISGRGDTVISGLPFTVSTLIRRVLEGLPINFDIAPTILTTSEAWGIGTGRGQILEALSVTGDYFSPWFDNTGTLRFIRSFDPATQYPDFDFDVHPVVMRDQILETDDLLLAPNRFIVISNAADNPFGPAFGVVDISPNAPHSIQNRGFVVSKVEDMQVSGNTQAIAAAQNLANRFTIFERVNLSTPPDPRHDSYNVIRWQGSLWLELAWDMALIEGGLMSHTLRKSYPL